MSVDFLAEVEELLNEAKGSPQGSIALKEVCERYQGTAVYIPLFSAVYRAYRDEQIRLNFKGKNYKELAEKWELSERQVRNIVKSGPVAFSEQKF
ncbi:MAG: Mor transcription activator family protein [Thermodesulfobacteriota bacterium]